jgi:rod shape determining protein RodA
VLEKQGLRLGIAILFMFGIAQIPPRFFKSIAPWLYGFALILLMSVLILGQVSKGGQRWLDLWFLRFQPAELMKIAVPMMVAKYLEDHLLPPKLSLLWIPFLLILVPALLIAKQPDLGTALLILSSGLFVIFFSGISWKMVFSCGSLLALCLPALWFFMRDYQKQRILVLLDPQRDPLGSGYQIIQSKIAIGSGGLYGKGWLNGTQSHLEFLPERTTDFIFAVFSEEFGLVGCLVLIMLYLYIIIRGLYISVQAQNTFSRLLAGSLTMTLFVYVFVNIGMVTGILPVVGIPLPLVSYGGTSLVTLMASFGILMSIHTHRNLLAK